MNNRIVILCGSFNPITKAHVDNAKRAMELVSADRCVLVPTAGDYILSKVVKARGRMALSDADRLAMIQSVCQENPGFSYSDFEINNKNSNHTHLTIEHIAKLNPDAELFYSCGVDKVHSMKRWNRVESIYQNLKIIVFARDGVDPMDEIMKHVPEHKDSFVIGPSIGDNEDISSTRVRNLFLSGDDSYKDFVPQGVFAILSKYTPSDFPMVTLPMWIKQMHKYGGMHGPETALKALYEENKSLMTAYPVGNTLFETPSDFSPSKSYNTTVEITLNDARSLLESSKSSSSKTAIISVCNRAKACGGYADGIFKTKLDEEELCRISNLSSYLYPYGNPKLKAIRECGLSPIENKYPIDFGTTIYCENVTFLRATKAEWYRACDPIQCNVILTPALSLRTSETSKLLLGDLAYQNADGRLNPEGMKVLESSIRNAFITAANHHIDTLILGDFGITGYHIHVLDIQEILSHILKEFDGAFKHIFISLAVKTKKYDPLYTLV